MAEQKKHDVPDDFVPVSDTQEQAIQPKIIEAERWRAGAKVIYTGILEWKGGRGEKFRAHTVMGVDDETRTPYGIWCTSVLDRLLEHVPSGEVVFLRYDGMQVHPTLPDRSIHKWTVARSKKAPPPAPASEPEGLPFK